MNFDTENSQNNLILDTDNNSLSSSLDLDYGLDPIADEFSGELQLNSIAGEMPLELETLPLAENDPHQLVFIGSDVIDHQTLVDNISGATDVVLLDSHSDELVQISEHLSNYQDLDAVHIVSHGEPGQLSFSNAQLNQDTLPEYVHLLEDWGNSLSAEADLLFYGCDVASGEQGNAFIQQISQITDADVAASVDDTGIDGNWKLEAQVGEIEATSAFSDGINQAYQHNLDNFTFASISESFDGGGGGSISDGGIATLDAFDQQLNNELYGGDDGDSDSGSNSLDPDFAFPGDEAFDAEFYLEKYSDVEDDGADPRQHFVQSGWKEGRDPNEVFDTSFYLYNNPDVASDGINPLQHYYEFAATDTVERYQNRVFQSFGESQTAVVVSADINDSQFASLKDQIIDNKQLFAAGLAVPFIVVGGPKVIIITAATLAIIAAASNIEKLLDDKDVEVFVPEGDIDASTPPFDLESAVEINLESFPKKDPFLESVLNGQFEFPDVEEGGSYFLAIEGVSTFREVEIANEQGKTLGEFDVIDLNNNIFIENKSATGLDRVNPKTGLPAQTVQGFVDKQIVGITTTRINRLNNEATSTVVTKNGTQTIPELSEIINIKEFVFRLEGDTPELREAVQNGINTLKERFPDYKFSAEYGV